MSSTATTATTSDTPSSMPYLNSTSPETSSTSTASSGSFEYPKASTPSFIPEQCLFCPLQSTDFATSVIHMRKSHGLFVPQPEHLLVDLETFFRYLHLVIFEYRECIRCGSQRATVQAVQQHMAGKGHCSFDLTDPSSEYIDFYDFSSSESDEELLEANSDDENQDAMAMHSSRKPLKVDEDSIRLPSGKIVTRQSSIQPGPSLTSSRHHPRKLHSPLQHAGIEPDDDARSSEREPDSDKHETQLSKREKRERAMVTYQLENMSTNDRTTLMHLPTSQQRAVLSMQKKQIDKAQKDESRRQTKIDRKGNKNLYAYWHTETPVYQCG